MSCNVSPRKFNFKVLEASFTNHFPISIEFSSALVDTPVEIKSVVKIKWDSKKCSEFCRILDFEMNGRSISTIDQILNSIRKSADYCGMTKQCKLNGDKVMRGAPWFDANCKNAKKTVYQALRKLRSTKTNDDYVSHYIKAKRNYNEVLIIAEKEHFSNIQLKLNSSKNPKEFYQALSIFRNKKLNLGIRKQVPIETFKVYFENVFKLEIEEYVEETYTFPIIESEDLDKDFSLEELEYALKKLSINKSPGNDRIPNEVWKALSHLTKSKLIRIFSSLFNSNEFPENWSEIIISPLYKKSDPLQPSNYRPISLANTVLKLFTQLISNRLHLWNESNNILSDYQGAYKRKTGCAEHVFILTAALQYNINLNHKVYGLFVDMSQAFDTINHRRLWLKLHKLGLSTKVLLTMKSIYNLAKAKIRTNYDISDAFQIEKGVLQGETVSPIMWNMYLEDLVITLNKSDTIPIKLKNRKIHVLLYADDIVLLAYSPYELQKKINILSRYLNENGLRVNLGKTKSIIFSNRVDKSNLNLNWQNEQIERVKTYAYLGVPFSENLSFKNAKTHFIKRAETAITEINCLIYKSRMNNFGSIMALYNSLIRSIVMYCAPIWCLDFGKDLEKLRIRFLKSLFLLPKMTPDWILRLELDLKNTEIFLLLSSLKFWVKLCHKNKDSLVYNAYYSLKLTKQSNLNWYHKLCKLCEKWNCANLLEISHGNLDTVLSRNLLVRKIVKQISIVNENSVSIDIIKMRETRLFSNYSLNKTHCFKEQYLYAYDIKWSNKQLILQLKLGISHITHKGKVIRLRALELLYKKVDDNVCQLCGKDTEDVYHILYECTHYATERDKFIKPLNRINNGESEFNRENYVTLFNRISKFESSNLAYFFYYSCQRRLHFMLEMNICT